MFGLGLMGEPAARRLLKAGHEIQISADRSTHAVGRLKADGAVVSPNVDEALDGADVIFTCLPDGDAVDEVLFGANSSRLDRAPGALVIDLSTVGPRAARATGANLEALGLRYVDAPVSGGPAGAASGTLVVFAGGTAGAVKDASAVCGAFASRVVHMGPTGQGQVAKLSNNLLVAAIMLANAQALALAERNGLSSMDLVPVLTSASGTNWQLENTVPKTILNDDYAPLFSLANLVKDARLIAEAIHEAGIDAPSFDLILRQYEQTLHAFGPDKDFSSVFQSLMGKR